MKALARFDTPEDAYLFRAFLESRGIAATVLDEHLIQLFWYYSNALGGVRVVLNDAADLAAALEAHQEYSRALRAKPVLVSEVRAWPLVLLLSWLMGGPMLIFGRRRVTPDVQPID